MNKPFLRLVCRHPACMRSVSRQPAGPSGAAGAADNSNTRRRQHKMFNNEFVTWTNIAHSCGNKCAQLWRVEWAPVSSVVAQRGHSTVMRYLQLKPVPHIENDSWRENKEKPDIEKAQKFSPTKEPGRLIGC